VPRATGRWFLATARPPCLIRATRVVLHKATLLCGSYEADDENEVNVQNNTALKCAKITQLLVQYVVSKMVTIEGSGIA